MISIATTPTRSTSHQTLIFSATQGMQHIFGKQHPAFGAPSTVNGDPPQPRIYGTPKRSHLQGRPPILPPTEASPCVFPPWNKPPEFEVSALSLVLFMPSLEERRLPILLLLTLDPSLPARHLHYLPDSFVQFNLSKPLLLPLTDK